jgi:RHS repeat-associated protein
MERTFTYDAENRQVTATINGAASSYAYDGDGRRVQSTTPIGTTTYVYDAMGQLAAEYSSIIPKESGTIYVTGDHLGSTRVVTDPNGNTLECLDYYPFGAEIGATVDNRPVCYSSGTYPANPDVLSEKFTGKERDAEAGLDFFEARYMSSAQGRLMSPDLIGNLVADPTDPQSWNFYAYVENNPLVFVDPTGTCSVKEGDTAATDDPGSPCVSPGDTGTTVTAAAPQAPYDQADYSFGGTGVTFSTTVFGKGLQQPKSKAQRQACAAEFGTNHSIAAAFGAQRNFVAGLFGGNTFLGLVNLGLFVSGNKTPTRQQLASLPLKGAAQGIPVPPGNPGLSGATGRVRSIVVQAAVAGAYNTIAGVGAEPIDLGITAAGTVATPVATSTAQLGTQTLTNVATGVGVAKFGFDFATFMWGLGVACR